MTRPDVIPADRMRFSIVPSDTAPMSISGTHDLAISPDGTQVVYVGPAPGGTQLYLRPVDQLAGMPLRGAEGGFGPFLSPDGEWVGFLTSQTTLQKVSIFGGPPVTLTESPHLIRGASWGTDNQIVFGTFGAGLFRIPDGGGEGDVLTNVTAGEVSHVSPFVIPGANAVLFAASSLPSATVTNSQLAVVDLDTGEVIQLGLAGISPRYVSTGHLVYVNADGSVHAAPFDTTRLEVTGNSVPVLEDVRVGSSRANFSVSNQGRLVYVAGGSGPLLRSLVWVSRDGREEPIAAPSRPYQTPRISPDGTQVALDTRDQEEDIWILDLTRDDGLRQLTFNAGADYSGHWTPDGLRVVFASLREGEDVFNLFWKAADGTGIAERLAESDTHHFVNAVTDSIVIARGFGTDATENDIVTVSLGEARATEVLIGTEFSEYSAALSPNGAWVAYQSDRSGRFEIYVQPFPDVEEGGLSLISPAGGQYPVWSPDGRELFYRDLAGRMMAAPVQTEPTFGFRAPEALFDGPYLVGPISARAYDIASDGRFLMIKEGADDAAPPQIVVALNWGQELLERVPLP